MKTIELPNDPSAECGVLACMFISQGRAFDAAVEILGTDGGMFYNAKNRTLYAAMVGVRGQGAMVDPAALLSHTGDPGVARQVSELYESKPTSANIEHYARQVRAAWQRRQLVDVARRLDRRARSQADPAEAMAELDAEVLALSKASSAAAEVITAEVGSAEALTCLERQAQADWQGNGRTVRPGRLGQTHRRTPRRRPHRIGGAAFRGEVGFRAEPGPSCRGTVQYPSVVHLPRNGIGTTLATSACHCRSIVSRPVQHGVSGPD